MVRLDKKITVAILKEQPLLFSVTLSKLGQLGITNKIGQPDLKSGYEISWRLINDLDSNDEILFQLKGPILIKIGLQ